MSYTIRKLEVEDYLLYKEIRLELLSANPTSFGSSKEDESLFRDEVWKKRLSKTYVDTFGAFIDNQIVGLCVLVRSPRTKMKHTATINSMYVKPKYRNLGIAYALVTKAEFAALFKGVERLNLSVVETNKTAYKLYRKLGFIEYGIEPGAIKYDNKYYNLIIMSKFIKK